MKSKYFRTQDSFLRLCEFSDGEMEFPLISAQTLDLSQPLELLSWSDTRLDDKKNQHKGVHFFNDDYRFEHLARDPLRAVAKLKQYRFVTSPDYSVYPEMAKYRQIWSVANNRYCGYKWQQAGLLVIPTVSWGLSDSFSFCFNGIEHGAGVAVSTVGCKKFKHNFLDGYNRMLEVLEPSFVICFGSLFAEMKGPLYVVDYIQSRRGNR